MACCVCAATKLCSFARANLVFVVDSSSVICGGSSQCPAWSSIRNFLRDIVNELSIGANAVRVGLVRYGTGSSIQSIFTMSSQQVRFTWICVQARLYSFMKIFYSPNKHGRRINNTTIIRTTQLQSRQKTLEARFKLDTRLAHNTLGKAKPKYYWQYFTISIFLVVQSFMKNILITKSRDCRSDLVKGHASRPYSSTGKHLTYLCNVFYFWLYIFQHCGKTINF